MSEQKVTRAPLNVLDELIKLGADFQIGGPRGPITDSNELDKFIQSKTPGRRDLLQELRDFFALYEYIQTKGLILGENLLSEFERLRGLPTERRIERLHEINQALLRKVKDEYAATQLRQ